MPQSVATLLMFEGQAEKAMALYMSAFRGSTVLLMEKYGADDDGPEGTVKRAEFTVARHSLMCIDSPIKHGFGFTPAVSLFVNCEDEAELVEAFGLLSDGGEVLMPLDNYGFSEKFCWINDRFGVSWQLSLG
ncbi:MAG: VOC family protein [Candidatus Methylacidiphilales bacterium]|nr:VOC family protein [Candidatus Methylacidiphilales bacterium]